MIQFDPPYKGTDKTTNFPLIVLGIATSTAQGKEFFFALVIKDDGDMGTLNLSDVNVDWRWDAKQRTFISIDDPAPE